MPGLSAIVDFKFAFFIFSSPQASAAARGGCRQVPNAGPTLFASVTSRKTAAFEGRVPQSKGAWRGDPRSRPYSVRTCKGLPARPLPPLRSNFSGGMLVQGRAWQRVPFGQHGSLRAHLASSHPEGACATMAKFGRRFFETRTHPYTPSFIDIAQNTQGINRQTNWHRCKGQLRRGTAWAGCVSLSCWLAMLRYVLCVPK